MKPILALLRPRHDDGVDRLMLLVLAISHLAIWSGGVPREGIGVALGVTLGVAVSLVFLARRFGGLWPARWAIALAMVATVGWSIQVSGGRPAAHAQVYAALSLLLFYRDPRLILGSAGLFIGHHLLFSALQARGLPVDLLRGSVEVPPAWLHLGTIGLQAALLASLAWREQLAARESRELEVLIQAMGREGRIRLALDVIRAETPAGKRLQQVQQRMAAAMVEVRSAGRLIAEAAERVAQGSNDLLRRTDQTASGLKDSSVCLDQIGVIVQNNTEASSEAQAMSTRAAAMADGGNRLVAEVVRNMEAIEASSRRIHEITAVIDSIAFQTNILALNAAVEAARAGDQGRGFAVVAGEVRALAQRSAAAAREIKTLISESVSTVAQGTQLVNGAGSTMTELVTSVRRVGELFQSMMADTSEQVQGLHTVSESIGSLSQTTQQNVSVAEDAEQAAADLRGQAERLAAVLESFRLPEEMPGGFSVAPPAAGGPGAGVPAAPPPAARPAAAPPAAQAARAKAAAPAAPTAGQGVVEYF